jgi:hypothetical protein
VKNQDHFFTLVKVFFMWNEFSHPIFTKMALTPQGKKIRPEDGVGTWKILDGTPNRA